MNSHWEIELRKVDNGYVLAIRNRAKLGHVVETIYTDVDSACAGLMKAAGHVATMQHLSEPETKEAI